MLFAPIPGAKPGDQPTALFLGPPGENPGGQMMAMASSGGLEAGVVTAVWEAGNQVVEVTEADLAEALEGIFGPVPGRPSRVRPRAVDAEMTDFLESIFGPRPGAVRRPSSGAEWDAAAVEAFGPRPVETTPDGVWRSEMFTLRESVFGPAHRGRSSRQVRTAPRLGRPAHPRECRRRFRR